MKKVSPFMIYKGSPKPFGIWPIIGKIQKRQWDTTFR